MEPGTGLIVGNMDVMELDGAVDHRSRVQGSPAGFRAGHWFTPNSDIQLNAVGLQTPRPCEAAVLTVGSRNFPITAQRGCELWITFKQLCSAPTFENEYLQWV